MGFNLLDEPWIPVRRASGRVERIAPWQISETSDPPVRIESPRPDFDAALLEFLIGLLQLALTPEDTDEWERLYEGVAPEILREKLLPFHDAFWLDGDGPRFMQDLKVHEDARVSEMPIAGVLIDQGTADQANLFAKGTYRELGLAAAAAAMLTLQQFAPSGGAGHRTSMRGGGPLSVTIKAESLWRTIWCNVLERDDLESLPGNHRHREIGSSLPWMVATKTSEQGTAGTQPPEIHPLQHYFGLPRRFRLVIDEAATGRCAVYGEDGQVVRAFHSRPGGTNYVGPFRHPLTPYSEGQEGQPPNPRKGASGVAYRDWPMLTIGGHKLIPPKAVEAFLQRERWRVAQVGRVVARGYAMDNMKALSFIEAEAPLLHTPAGILPLLRADATGLVAASESIRRTLSKQTKAAWKDRPADQSGDVEARTDASFWSATEGAFYLALDQLTGALALDSDDARTVAKRDFLASCHVEAIRIFDRLCPLDAEQGSDGLARVVRARRDLVSYTRPESPVLLRCVGLAAPDTEKKRKSKSRKELRS